MSGETAGFRWQLDVVPYNGVALDPLQQSPWLPLQMVLSVRTPTGRVIQVDTVRLRPRPRG